MHTAQTSPNLRNFPQILLLKIVNRLHVKCASSPTAHLHSKQPEICEATVPVNVLWSSTWLLLCCLSSAVWRTAAAGQTGGPGGAAAWRLWRRSASSAHWPARPARQSLTAVWRSSTRPAHSATCRLHRLLLRDGQCSGEPADVNCLNHNLFNAFFN